MSTLTSTRSSGGCLTRDGTAGVDDAFLALPHAVYAGDPCWIPEDADAVRAAFSASNPWFGEGGGHAMTLCVPGRARLAVFRQPGCVVAGAPAAFFGYWEEAGDGAATALLLERARSWARDAGAAALYGPVNFTTFGNYRLRVDADGGVPFPGEPYNPPRYAPLLEQLGFTAARHYVTQVGAPRARPFGEKARVRDAVLEAGFRMEPLDAARWMAMLPELHRAADEIFGDAFAYTPVPFAQFAAGHGAPVAARLCPRTSLVARDADGALAGILLAYPHYGPVVVQGAGAQRVRTAALHFDTHAPLVAAERTAVVKTVGVVRAHRRRGLMDAMVVSAVERGRAHYDRWVGALIRADNPSRRFARAQLDGERAYALYGRSLTEVGHVAHA